MESKHNANGEVTTLEPEKSLPLGSPHLIRPLVLITFPSRIFTTLSTMEITERRYTFLFNIGLLHSAVSSLGTKTLAIFSVLYPQVLGSYWTLSKYLLKEINTQEVLYDCDITARLTAPTFSGKKAGSVEGLWPRVAERREKGSGL